MNATNRFANRAVLLLGAFVLGAAGLLAIAAGVRVPAVDAWLGSVGERADELTAPWSVQLAEGERIAGIAVAGIVLAAVVAVAAVIFLATRGGGRTSEVMRSEGAGGTTSVDRSVADDVLAEGITARPDVLSVRTGAYRVTRSPALAVTVRVRRGARLDAVLDTAESAVQEWDALLGRRMPVLVHLADGGWREVLGSRSRTRTR